MARYTVEAVVLKFTNYKDADKIFSLFTREKGKISATAKGVRKISSRRGGNLDTLNHISVGITEGENQKYKIITEVKTLDSFKNLKNSLENSVKGFYIVELIHRLLDEGQHNEAVFDLLVSNLKKLDTHLNNEVSRINAFEISLLQNLGYGLYLDKCAITGRKYDGSWESVKFNPVLGGFVSEPSAPGLQLDKSTADLLFALKTKTRIGKTLLENSSAVKEADRILKMYIREVLEGSLKTERVFGSL